MPNWRSILSLYLNTSIHIGICTIAITAFSFEVFSTPVYEAYIAFLLFGTITLYNLHKIITVRRHRTNSIVRYQKIVQLLPIIRWTTLMSGICSLYFSYFIFCEFNRLLLPVLLISGALSILYVIPILPNNLRIRDFSLVKIFIVSLVWSLLTCLIPGILGTKYDLVILSLFCIERFLFIFSITIPFDIRDYELEKSNHLKTIPLVIGIQWSKILSITTLLMATLINLYFYYSNYYPMDIFISIILSYICTVLLIAHSSKSKSNEYFIGWIDGTMILPFVFYYLLRYF